MTKAEFNVMTSVCARLVRTNDLTEEGVYVLSAHLNTMSTGTTFDRADFLKACLPHRGTRYRGTR